MGVELSKEGKKEMGVALRFVLFFAFVAAVQAVPTATRTVHMVAPRSESLPINDPHIQWEPVTPFDNTQIMLQEEEGTSLEVTPTDAISCSIQSGCTCKAQYYYGHIETADCAVYVPEAYHNDQFACQYFMQGGALFLYGNKWKKAVTPTTGPINGEMYFCN